MDLKKLRKTINIIAYAMAATFLAIHIAMLTIFQLNGVTPMVYINIGSIVFYVTMLFLIHKGYLTAYTIATFLEIIAHMVLAIIFTGWGAGFQITIIGIVILLFFCEYIARSLNIAYVRSIYLAPIAAAAYLSSFIVTLFYTSPYSLPKEINIALQIGWGVIVFGIMSVILLFFVSTINATQSELTNEVTHDKLTGLPNRYFMASLFQRIEEEQGKKRHWIAIADLDDFKSINDSYGHNCGDYILKEFASILSNASKDIVVCRWGGEEFLLLGDEESTSPDAVLEEIRKQVEAYPFEYDGVSMKLTVTIGYSYKEDNQSIDEWINDADKLLYKGKESGKNRIN